MNNMNKKKTIIITITTEQHERICMAITMIITITTEQHERICMVITMIITITTGQHVFTTCRVSVRMLRV